MDLATAIFGTSNVPLTWWQMCTRALLIFCFLLVLLRLSGKRAFSQSTTLDIVLSIMLGSVLSRALTGNAPLGPTFAASVLLVAAHKLCAIYATRSARFGEWVKGTEPVQLIRDGKPLQDALTQHQITQSDLLEGLRSRCHREDMACIAAAYLERSGKLSFVLSNAREISVRPSQSSHAQD